MKFRFLLLCTTSIAFAIPLHQGQTWTWKVSPLADQHHAANPYLKVESRTATVLDSVPLDSTMAAWSYRAVHAGTFLWHIEVLDSSSQAIDTARLLSYPDGIQLWERSSNLLAWEPTQLSALQEFGLVQDSGNGKTYLCELFDSSGAFKFQHPYPWGSGTVLSGLAKAQRGRCDTNRFIQDYSQGLLWRPSYEVSWGYSFPWLSTDSTGVLQFRDHAQNWELVAYNGRPVSLPGPRWGIPSVGSAWTWSETRSSYVWGGFGIPGTWKTNTRLVLDSVTATFEDSAGWRGVDLRETTDSTTKEYRCRILRTAPETRSNCPDIASTWVRDWREVEFEGYSTLEEHSCGDGHISTSCTVEFRKIRTDGLLDSSYSSEESKDGPSRMHMTEFVRQLMSVNGIAIRENLVGIKSTRTGVPHENVEKLASRYPSTIVFWHDLAGRSGTLRASELLKPTASPRILLLDATFPDGTRWQGKHLLGSRRATR
jgi:hypothetical protein